VRGGNFACRFMLGGKDKQSPWGFFRKGAVEIEYSQVRHGKRQYLELNGGGG